MGNTYRSKQFRKVKNNRSLLVKLYGQYRYKAKIRGLTFTINIDEFQGLIFNRCYLCGSPPQNRIHRRNIVGELIYNGLDRVDSSRGYEIDNVKACCFKCNIMKMKTPLKDFKRQVSKIFKFSIPFRLSSMPSKK